LEGRDLRKLPQLARKQTLSDLLGENDIDLPIIYSEHLTGDGQEMFEHASKLNFEGIVSIRADAPYRSERTVAWLKIKSVQKGKFPVIGFVKDPTGVAALYLGKREGKDLIHMGKVGTGWSRTVSSQIRKGHAFLLTEAGMLDNCFNRVVSNDEVGASEITVFRQ
jgi:bifunctional non-homologous end joining protein LigD